MRIIFPEEKIGEKAKTNNGKYLLYA